MSAINNTSSDLSPYATTVSVAELADTKVNKAGDTMTGSLTAPSFIANGIDCSVDSQGDGWIRYSNGLQICWMKVISPVNTWSVFAYPKSFIEVPSVSLTASGWDGQKPSIVSTGMQTTNTQIEMRYNGIECVYVQAIGKWK